MRVIFSFLLGLIFVTIFCTPVRAVTITINTFPASIDNLDQFQVTASISGAMNATNYLRLDLYKDGSSNYFGETYNGVDWYSGSDGKSYFPVTIQNSSASATFFGRLGNPTQNQYPESGTYKLKIRRYTSSGSASSNDSQTPMDVQINYAIATPSPPPTLSPTPIPKTPSPTPTGTKLPTPKPTLIAASTEIPIIIAQTPSPSPSEIPKVLGEKTSFPILGFVLIGAGGLIILSSIVYTIWSAKKDLKAD